MSRGPITFRQRDVSAAMKAATDAGYAVVRVEIDKTGKIVLITSKAGRTAEEEVNQWDAVLS
jgi:hypothetical protein